MKAPVLSIVVPCYNEQEVFTLCLNELSSVLNSMVDKGKIDANSHIVFVDDGSKDLTWSLIKEESNKNYKVKGVKLSRNKGHQTALMAGLSSCINSDITVSIDADLQDDTSVIEKMVDSYLSGHDIVYGVRNDRASDSFFKKFTAETFYKVMTKLGVSQVENHADFRLLSKRALDALLQYREQNLYIRGLIPLIGFPSEKVYYSRSERAAGESKYPLRKMLALALEGITSFSVTPLRMVTAMGFVISMLSSLGIVYTLVQYFMGHTVSGWASVILAVLFIGGVQMLCLGVIGEYIGKIYMESKGRPKYFIDEKSWGEK
ncbi:glycosyltransferase family 2 protein [Enterobacter cloacae subsp. cloacae]|uniref:Glycosyl transferase, family 2 n=2 Tax=Enterobacter cloacae TaxID=550 RepID=A0A0H3CG87_ENTCC|nr:glycosyltransferase family 2 protein [Enterobacter cloacae]ADF60909.1 Glycosyl transferase, family 2 [Enterobacter cloacae subsp. cloacae ATCC 13047]KGB12210.1 glycosyltransferase like 2 family protein [Enterobacter cloacae]MBW4207361.1 glycosyltransferase family 2 protein [Enterobacter cloacae subsp. cloacae]MBW4230092.1 glycosyltransferase family 2 protein [Enterobacter cloacae subsp. cloacae]MCJ8535235.1 glycosyltransferase family 2 protein [Enterobacter cloacae]